MEITYAVHKDLTGEQIDDAEALAGARRIVAVQGTEFLRKHPEIAVGDVKIVEIVFDRGPEKVQRVEWQARPVQ